MASLLTEELGHTTTRCRGPWALLVARCSSLVRSGPAWLQRPAEDRNAADCEEIDGQRAALRGEVDLAEELQAAVGREIRLAGRRRLEEDDLRSERAVERVRSERAGVERSGDEFPEAVEVAERRLRRI